MFGYTMDRIIRVQYPFDEYAVKILKKVASISVEFATSALRNSDSLAEANGNKNASCQTL
jgi:hypothetical protein